MTVGSDLLLPLPLALPLMASLSGLDVAQWGATGLMTVIGSAAFWGYWKDRKVAKARGTVATSTVEIQVEGARVQNLEQRFAFAQKAWDEERTSFERRIKDLEEQLSAERTERSEEERLSQEKIQKLEARVLGMQRELDEVMDEVSALRRVREKGGGTPPKKP
jgi:chromosome segregation ATPase